MAPTDPYKTLGVQPDATREEVIKAYNRLALKHNPSQHPEDPLAEPMFVLVTEAFLRIMLDRHAERSEAEANPLTLAERSPNQAVVRFDGLYQAEAESDTFSYLRFYANHIVLAVTSPGRPDEVARWFNTDHEFVAMGGYEIVEREIHFLAQSTLGIVAYSGIVEDPERLILSWRSRINGRSGGTVYNFVHTSFEQVPEKMSPPQQPESSPEPPESDAASSSSDQSPHNPNAAIRVDGVYEAARDGSFDYLRFYSDRTVQMVNDVESPRVAWTWFDETRPVGIGVYEVSGRYIDFSIRGGLTVTEYAGVIEGERLVLKWWRDVDRASGERTYRFMEAPFTATPRESSLPDEATPNMVDRRAEVWKALTWALGAMAVIAITSFIIVSNHVREASAWGLALMLVILVSLGLLWASAADLMTAWTAYRESQHRKPPV